MVDKSEYQLHRQQGADWQQLIGQRDGQRALRADVRVTVPARAGLWDYAMIAGGTLAALAQRHVDWTVAGIAAACLCAAVLVGCGGGEEPLDAKETVQPVACGGGITSSTCTK